MFNSTHILTQWILCLNMRLYTLHLFGLVDVGALRGLNVTILQTMIYLFPRKQITTQKAKTKLFVVLAVNESKRKAIIQLSYIARNA